MRMARVMHLLLCACFSIAMTSAASPAAAPASRPERPARPAHSGLADKITDLSDSDPLVRTRAAEALGYAEPKAYFAANALIKAAADREPAVKAAAIEALGRPI
jgi:HEAT repeat protein